MKKLMGIKVPEEDGKLTKRNNKKTMPQGGCEV